jgi:PLP dependent protein
MTSLSDRLSNVRARIDAAAARVGRSPDDILLLAVTKTQPLELLREAYDLGLRDFGESRVQEVRSKQDQLPSDIRWHFIGPLQTNKAKYLAPFVALVHSVNSLGLMKELGKRATQAQRAVEFLFEINISGEHQKVGLNAEDLPQLIEHVTQIPKLVPRGLMGMASWEEDPEGTREQFRSLKLLHTTLLSQFPHLHRFDQLSMGMTNDFEVAIEEGSTIVRVGSALFGERELSIP